ncbi:MAG: single-stranded-DNA-specific exonuclease RecJ, partial [Dehalococcoidia bacterium]|nr:single-stranded-DNA-specific exonuclease RecJ [Dehalococcoidia bacterium]
MTGGVSQQGLRKRWDIQPAAPSQQLTTLPHLPPLMVQILYNRGISEPGEVDAFLYDVEGLGVDPFLLADMEQAVSRLARAIERNESLAVYGDFDVDGVAGTALLVQFLSRQGIKVIPYIPHRGREGYGLNCQALEQLRDKGVQLVITVDCGTSSVEEVRHALTLGMEVIITDHHSIPDVLPPALAVVNPRRADSAYPFRELSGTGVAYKLAEALSLYLNNGDANVEDNLDLAALGTIVDMVPLTGENRLLARRGLDMLNTTPRLGLRELMRVARLAQGRISSETISYSIGPRLNSAGRLDHAMVSYRLLTTDSLTEAQEIAKILEVQNTQRQRLTQEGLDSAREKATTQVKRFPILMVGSRSFTPGVIGLIASRLAEEFYRPAMVLEVGDTESRGSARSIPQFDIHRALTQCSDLLTRFGGHPQAAGFTVPNRNLNALRQRLIGLAETALSGVVLEPSLTVDAEVRLEELDWAAVRSIQNLAPFGKGNPSPTLLTQGVRVVECRKAGNNHLRLKLHDGKLTWPAIAFGFGNVSAVKANCRLDIVYHVGVDFW